MPIDQKPNAVDDPTRLAALDALAILDTPSEPGFDDIVHVASLACGTPVALVSLVAADRQWFKANVGFPQCETDLNSSVCAHALTEPDLLVIPDLTADPRTAANPLVTGEPFIRFYAGAPLRLATGEVLGSLCVIDRTSRPEGLTLAQAEMLRRLARQVIVQIELRRAVAERDTFLAGQRDVIREREAQTRTQIAVSTSGGDLDTILEALVSGAMEAVPAAEAGVMELIDGTDLEYRAVKGSIAHHLGLRVPLDGSLAGRCALNDEPMLVGDVLKLDWAKKDLAQILQLRSAVFAPVSRGGKVLGVLKLQSSRPDAFVGRDLDLARLFAGLASAGLTEAREVQAQRAVLASEARYRAVFESATDYAIIVMDLEGHVTNWNSGAEKLLGWSADEMHGRTLDGIFTPEDREAGIPDREMRSAFESGRGIDERWHLRKSGERFFAQGELVALRFDGGEPLGFVKILRDRTEQRRMLDRLQVSEKHKAALVDLGDLLRDLTDISEIAHSTAEIVGRTLGVSRAGFGRVDPDIDWVEIERDWTAKDQVSIAGRHRFGDYGNLRQALAEGKPLVIDDIRTDVRTEAFTGPFKTIGVDAMVNMPIRERGRIVALFFVHDSKPRHWTSEEIGFVRAVADRLEAADARMQAEQQQHVLNQELSHRLKNTLAMVQAIASQTLRGVTERDAVVAFQDRLTALSKAHDLLLQQSWAAAPIHVVIEAALALHADPQRFDIEGPPLLLNARAVLSITLLLHELATNAVKYGALSVPDGKVRLRWAITGHDAEGEVAMTWTEDGGPLVVKATRRGFGSRLISMGLAGTGKTDLRFDSTGLHAAFRAPLNVVTDREG